jgi:two-component system, NarL family, nitrate/nitrite response regulator NarL
VTRVVLVSNEPVLAAGLAAILAPFTAIQLELIGSFDPSLAATVGLMDPDVLLLDFDAEQFPVLLDLRNTLPKCRIILWMRGVPLEVGCQTMRLGVRGILRKTVEPDLIVKCLTKVAAGQLWFDTELTSGFLEARTVSLTRRESQIVPLVAQGLKNKQIAAELNIAEATIRIYLSNLFRKLEVADRYELAIYGMKNMMLAASTCGRTENAKRPSLGFMVLDRPRAPVKIAAEMSRAEVLQARKAAGGGFRG